VSSKKQIVNNLEQLWENFFEHFKMSNKLSFMQDELHGGLPALHPPHPHHHHHQATLHLTTVEKVVKQLSPKIKTLLFRFSIKKSKLQTSVDLLMFQLSSHFTSM
jgi:hypothetical protein